MPVSKVEKPENCAIDSKDKNFLTDAEIQKFLKAARKGRHAVRVYCSLLRQND